MPSKPIGPPWFRDICAGYLRHLARKGRRPNTIRTYDFAVRDFGAWLEAEGIAAAEQLTGSGLERWQDERATELKPASQQTYAAAVRGVLRWAATQEPPMAPVTLWLRVSTPRTPRMLPKPIPQADLVKLCAALAPLPEPMEARRDRCGVPPGDLLRLRTRALFWLTLTSGARISEALSLERDQLQGRTASVIQKGGSQKLLVISAAAELAVNDYLRARSDACPALFVTHHPAKEPEPLARLSVQGAWDNLCRELGIQRFHTHQLRHTTATELLRQRVDSLVIAKHLGHRGLQTIAGYAQVGLETRHEMLEVLDGRIRRAS